MCSNGNQMEHMKKQLSEHEKKSTEYDAMRLKYEKLARDIQQMEHDGKEKEFEWRKKIAQLEKENHEIQKKSCLRLKTVRVEATTTTNVSALKEVYGQNNKQRDESDLQKKVSQLQKQLHETREKHRREKCKLRDDWKMELHNELETEIRAQLKKESKLCEDLPPRRKVPFRECRKRVGTYKE